LKVITRRKVKGLNTRKNKILNVDELNAIKKAYGKKIDGKDYITYVIVPGLMAGVLSMILLYYVWVSLIMMIVGFIYGAKVFLPKSIKKNYETASFIQRHKFVNNMTSILIDDGKTVSRALSAAVSRADGEFKDDLEVLQARLIGADENQIRNAYMQFEEKYQDDVIFVQYIEQLETATLEGRANTDTLEDITDYHNLIKEKQEEYERGKQGHLKDMRMLGGVVVIFIFAITFSFGFSTYLNDFTRHPVGWGTIAIYMTLMMIFFRQFSNYLFDDSIMEVKL